MISVELGGTLETYVRHLVESGRYASVSEVLCEGFRLLQHRETRLVAFDQTIARGLDDAAAGRTVLAEGVFGRLAHKHGE